MGIAYAFTGRQMTWFAVGLLVIGAAVGMVLTVALFAV